MDLEKKMDSLVSIIVPVYNVEQYVSRCINSILNQSYQNLEIILINDGSTDGTLAILRHFEKTDLRIKVIDQTNFGVSSARNHGIEKAMGDYIMFVDGDDWIDTDMIFSLLQLIDGYKADIACSSFVFDSITLSKKRYVNSNFSSYELKGEEALVHYLRGNHLWASVCSRLYAASFIKKHNFRFDTNMFIGEDGYFSLQVMSKASNIVICACPFYHILVRPSSVTRSCSFDKDEVSDFYKEYLIKENLWTKFENEYKVWYVRARSSDIFRVALRTNYRQYVRIYKSHIRESAFFQYNTNSIRMKMDYKRRLIALIANSQIATFCCMQILKSIHKFFLV